MPKRGSIKNKLITANLMTVMIAFIIVGVIVVLNLNGLSSTFLNMSDSRSQEVSQDMKQSSEEHMKKIQKFFADSLLNKGKNLLDRDSLVLKPMFMDNAFNTVRNLIGNLFALDEEILSLDFFVLETGEIKSWHFLNREHPEGLGLKTVYDMEKQAWISELDDKTIEVSDPNVQKIIKNAKKDVELIDYTYKTADGKSKTVKAYECIVPIFDGEPDELSEIIEEGEPVGFLRYILTLEKMQVAIEEEKSLLAAKTKKQESNNKAASLETKKAGKESLTKSLTNLGIGAIVVLILSFFLAMMVGKKVSDPILHLKDSAQIISQGDYSKEVAIESNDEIGILGETFENMRKQVKEFTENLQELVDGKTKEISDILDSIEQGIFTVNTDLSINPQHSSKAEDIYDISDFETAKLNTLLHADDAKLQEFDKWLALVSQPRKLKRWAKYSELCPVHEFAKVVNGEERTIELEYRPIIENEELQKLMVLSKDVTEERKVKAALEKTKRDQQLTLERVIGLINNDQGSLATFFEGYNKAVEDLKGIDLNSLSKDKIDDLFRQVHTVKGNAGSFGFQEVTRVAGIAEDFLEDAKTIENFTDEHKEQLQDAVNLMVLELEDINAMKAKLFSDNDDMMSVSRGQFQQLLASIQDGLVKDVDDIFKRLVQLDFNPFQSLCKKYSNIVKSYQDMGEKDVSDLEIKTPDTLIHRDMMNKFDMALVHLVRNSLDHGLESNEDRESAGKDKGKVSLSLLTENGHIQLIVEDNGKGINPSIIAEKALEKKVITNEEFENLSDAEKVNLIFHAGFSSKDEVSELSGRGVGMDAVKSSIEEFGGTVNIETEVGKGTKIILTIPNC